MFLIEKKTLRWVEYRFLIATCLLYYQLTTQSFTITDNESDTCLYAFGCGASKPMSVRTLEDKFDSGKVFPRYEFFDAR